MLNFFHYFTEDSNRSKIYVSWFLKQFPASEFSDTTLLLYSYLDYCNRLNIPATVDYLNSFIKTELRNAIRNFKIIPPNTTQVWDLQDLSHVENIFQILSNVLISTYEGIINKPCISHEDFKTLVYDFVMRGISERSTKIFLESHSLFSTSTDKRNTLEDTLAKMNSLSSIYDLDCLDELDILVRNTSENDEKAELIANPDIPCISNDYGMYSRALITGAGQPGYGKTRFFLSTYIYPALMSGIDCRIDSLELATYEIKNILLSHHIAKKYKVKIPDAIINRDKLTDDQRRIVDVARVELFEGNYGHLDVFEEDLYVTEAYNNMKSYLRTHPTCKVWLVDYIGLFRGSRKFHMDKTEIIDESLRVMKSIARKFRICSIGINQYNEKGNAAAEKGERIMVGMIQGGQAVQKHADYDIAMTATPNQYAANLRFISTTKCRSAVGFSNVPLLVDMSISNFKQETLKAGS